MQGFISLTTSLSSIFFDGIPYIVLCVGRGQRPVRGRGKTPSVYLDVAKKKKKLAITCTSGSYYHVGCGCRMWSPVSVG